MQQVKKPSRIRDDASHYEKPAPKLRCGSCGALANAACDCGVSYLPVKAIDAASKAIAANSAASNRAIAEKIGVNEETVRRARNQVRDYPAPEKKRVGRDGKSYKQPAKRFYGPEDVDKRAGITAEMIEAANATNRKAVFMRIAENSIRRAQQGAGLRDAKASEIDDEIMLVLNGVIRVWSELRTDLKRRKANG
jgi:hypothetical protein